ncbi:unnamed protein product (macronuclear) [Paramecium tetraurelia]|uniref:Transmembrane protein n=1 Tax=Paramecium tetraurelia TaxID=5888 RepID=A0BDL6_PARTE|nr:uncharacterized protein GSPATT00027662001 [Paramecium tetraurelia]CAK56633.1 unnamed protein product [Paramecium tetraurelia]|eukprot:XP_001424031.1 hypothetical protein (macronuclear) [Paramecium tetraurelia strain d4-2]
MRFNFQQQIRKSKIEDQLKDARKKYYNYGINLNDQHILNQNSSSEYQQKIQYELKNLEKQIEDDENYIISLAKSRFLEEIATPTLIQNFQAINSMFFQIFIKMIEFAKRKNLLWIILQFRHSQFLNCLQSLEHSNDFQRFINSLI